METITVTTKEDLEKAVEKGYSEIIVKGDKMCLLELKEKITKLSNNELNEIVEILEKLSHKPFVDVVFAGNISNGKSTVVNSLIKQNLLPSSVGSTTANLFLIKKGDNKIVTFLNNEIQEYDLTSEKLKELNNKKFDKIEVHLDNFPYKNVVFIDTPGINDIDKEKELISLEYIPFADIVVFVLDISKGLTKSEEEFFNNKILKSHKDKIFILLNKLDTIDDEGYMPKVLQDYQTFKISAKKYLAGVILQDENKIKESNFSEFKNSFENYLNSLDIVKLKKTRTKKLLEDINQIAEFQINEIMENLKLSKEELQIKLDKLKNELNEKKEILNKAFEEIDKKTNELKNFIEIRLSELKVNLKKASIREDIIIEFENALLDIKKKTNDIFKTIINDYDIQFDILDELLLFINSIINTLSEFIISSIDFAKGVIKEVIKDDDSDKAKEKAKKFEEKLNKVEFGTKIVNNVFSTTKSIKLNKTINENINNLKNSIIKEIDNISKEKKREIEFKELAEIKSSIYAIESSTKNISHKKEDIETKINYLENEKETIKKIVNQCKEELC